MFLTPGKEHPTPPNKIGAKRSRFGGGFRCVARTLPCYTCPLIYNNFECSVSGHIASICGLEVGSSSFPHRSIVNKRAYCFNTALSKRSGHIWAAPIASKTPLLSSDETNTPALD